MSTPRGVGFELPEGMESKAVYSSSGSFTPALADNARAALYLFTRAQADLWHFVFAPNPRTSAVGRLARRFRRIPVVQTIASPPRVFAPDVLFGDALVAQSTWTRDRIVEASGRVGVNLPVVDVIPPPVAAVPEPPEAEVGRLRRSLGIDEGRPVFIYPGDLEHGSGAREVAAAVEPLVRVLPGAVVVFACRAKTPRAPEVQAELQGRLDPEHVRFVGDGYALPTLLAASDVVLFPVDDLYGKVDLPISLLEAMCLGVPVVTPDEGPLADLKSVARAPLGATDVLVRVAVDLVMDRGRRDALVHAQWAEVEARFTAERVARAYEGVYDRLLEARAGRIAS
jgi:glycosyltransferase involved in cell wall biosynthesis